MRCTARLNSTNNEWVETDGSTTFWDEIWVFTGRDEDDLLGVEDGVKLYGQVVVAQPSEEAEPYDEALRKAGWTIIERDETEQTWVLER